MNLGASTWNGSFFPSREPNEFAKIWYNIRVIKAEISYLKHLVIYNNGALTGNAGGSILGIDYTTGNLYYKNSSGVWALAAGGGGGGGTVTSVTSSTGDIVVATGTTTPVLTLTTVNGKNLSYFDPTSSIQTQLNAKQGSLTLTTTGSGAATLSGSTLNIPTPTTGNLTGDVTSVGLATTLATVNSNVGTFGSATNVASATVNAKGLITAISNVPIQITETQVTNLTSDLAGKQATLVSGTNIKTVNGSSLLGSGNLTVAAGAPTLATNKVGVGNSSGVLDAVGTNSPTFNQSTLDLSNVTSVTGIKTINYNGGTGSTSATIGTSAYPTFMETYDDSYINGDGSPDQVRQWGYNQNGAGGVADSRDNFAIWLSLESKYFGTLGYQSEFHFQSNTPTGGEIRHWSYLIERDSGYTYKYNTVDQEDWFSTAVGSGGTPYFTIGPTKDMLYNSTSGAIRVTNTSSSSGFSIIATNSGDLGITNGGTGSVIINTGNSGAGFVVSDAAGQFINITRLGSSIISTPQLAFTNVTGGTTVQTTWSNQNTTMYDMYSPNTTQMYTGSSSFLHLYDISGGASILKYQFPNLGYATKAEWFSDGSMGFNTAGTNSTNGIVQINGTLAMENSNKILFAGSSSGAISVVPQAAAGTYNFNLPITAGTAGQALVSQGGGSTAMTWGHLSATATLAFPSTAAGSKSDLTITLTGAVSGDSVSLGVPAGSVPANGTFFAWVSTSNTVSVRFSNPDPLTAYQPASGTFKVSIVR